MKQKQNKQIYQFGKQTKNYLTGIISNWPFQSIKQKNQLNFSYFVAKNSTKIDKTPSKCQMNTQNIQDIMKKSTIYRKILNRSIQSKTSIQNYKNIKQKLENTHKRKNSQRISNYFRQAWQDQQKKSFASQIKSNKHSFIINNQQKDKKTSFKFFIDKNKKKIKQNNLNLHSNDIRYEQQMIILGNSSNIKQNNNCSLNSTISISPFKNIKIKKKLKLKTFSTTKYNELSISQGHQDLKISVKKSKQKKDINLLKTQYDIRDRKKQNMMESRSFLQNPQFLKVQLNVKSSQLHLQYKKQKQNKTKINRHQRLNEQANLQYINSKNNKINEKDKLDAWDASNLQQTDYIDQNTFF